MRRVTVAAFVALVALAGCAGPAPTAGGDGAPPSSGSAFPVTVEHSLGSTVIESRPERVVTLGFSDADVVVALGIKPVGIHSTYGFETGIGPWGEDELAALPGDAPQVWSGREYNYEAIAALAPDLIVNVSSDGLQATHDTLAAIAPTIALPAGASPYAATWQDTTLLVAEALGLGAEGGGLVADVEAYLSDLAAQNPGFAGRTVTYLDVLQGAAYAGGRDATAITTMGELGLEPVPYIRDLPGAETQIPISNELLSNVDADVLLVYPFGETEEATLAANPALAGLPAVQAGDVYWLQDLSLSAPSVLSIPYGVDGLVPFLQRATAG
jgi:iron complex transport system substrate-binding protein